MLRVGLVGCGQIADAHLQEIGGIDRARVVAVCDRNEDLARQAALRFSVPAHYSDLGQLFDAEYIDVLHVTTPPASHVPLALEAVDRDVHVYVEKPVALTAADTQTLMTAARERGRLICSGHDQLWDPSWIDFHRAIDGGAIGDVVHIDALQRYDARARLSLSRRIPIVLYVGRLVPVKGADVLIEASRALTERGVEHQLVLAGDGALRSTVLRFATTQPRDRVTLLGVVSHAELAWWYAAADVVAIPSRSEGIPNVCYEAVACGVPFVASRVGGIPDGARKGIDDLVEPGDASALAAALERSLRCPPVRRPLLVRSWADSARELAAVIRSVVSGRAPDVTAASRVATES